MSTSRNPPPLKVHAGIRGCIEAWQIINRDGSVAQEGSCENLILDQGLDFIASSGTPCGTSNNETNGTFHGIQRRLAVGTGSTEPAVTDTELVNEIARVDSTYQSPQDTWPSGSEHIRRRRQFFEFDFGVATGNLTEFGLSPSTSGNLATRELFRDAQGDPIVLTVTNDQKLRVAYTIEVTLSPTEFAAHSWDLDVIDSEGNTSVETKTGQYSWFHFPHSNNSQNRFTQGTLLVLHLMVTGYSPASSNSASNYWYGPDHLEESHANTVKGGSLANPNHSFSIGNTAPTSGDLMANPSYVAGEHKRTLVIQLDTSGWNGEHWGFSLKGVFCYVANDAADTFTKDNEQTLELTLVEISWARAA